MELNQVLSDHSNVHLAQDDLQSLLGRVQKIHEQGKDKLLVISEFDFTLTKAEVNGKLGSCSYFIIDSSPLMSKDYTREAGALKEKYLPMESNLELSLETRREFMYKWYSEAFRFHIKYNLKNKDIKEMVTSSNITLRNGTNDIFDILESNHVPYLIFSAGIGDTIIETVRQQSSIKNNVRFITNKLKFDENGVVCAIPDPIITSYSKGDPNCFSSVRDEIKGRCNIVLIGESLGDPDMLKGLETCDNVIKIGFLNHNVEKMLPTYLGLYDIVLTGDGDMRVITSLLQAILHTLN